ncbi:MAG: hypothetical protein ACQPRJ_02505 [Solitalea-like symbiont of Acarus siro]
MYSNNNIIRAWFIIIIFLCPFIIKVTHTHTHNHISDSKLNASYNYYNCDLGHDKNKCQICNFNSYIFYVHNLDLNAYRIISVVNSSIIVYKSSVYVYNYKLSNNLRGPPANISNTPFLV